MLDEVTTGLREVEGPLSNVGENEGVFAVLCSKGDTKHIWDRTKPVEVEMAKEMFEKYRKKGYLAFHVKGEDHTKGEQMNEFDPNAQRIIFAPPMQGG